MNKRVTVAVLMLLVLFSCAHTKYFLEPVNFKHNYPAAVPPGSLGRIYLQDVTIGANSDRFVKRELTRENFLDALETVLYAVGYEVVDEPVAPDTAHLRAKLYTVSNRGGCSGGWNTSRLDIVITQANEVVFQKGYTNKRRGRSGSRAYTAAVRACLDQFWKDLSSPRRIRQLNNGIMG